MELGEIEKVEEIEPWFIVPEEFPEEAPEPEPEPAPA